MPAPRVVAVAVPLLCCLAAVACRVSTQQNELYEGDQVHESAQEVARSPSQITSTRLDASEPEADASIDGDADAAARVPPPCTMQNMYASAPETTCAPDSYALVGGTIPLGNFHLTRWCDQQKGCSSYASERQATMSIEDVGGTLFMRWILVVDGQTKWGTYELTRTSPTSFTRTEVCNWTPQTPTVLVSYAAAANEILFVHDNGQEKWTRIPKALPPETIPSEPIFTNGR
jgi:hypothetical protein